MSEALAQAPACWRIARVAHACQFGVATDRCHNTIQPGQYYFDTGVYLDPERSHKTRKHCADHLAPQRRPMDAPPARRLS